MPQDELIPLKQVEGELGVSRSTFWRARQAVKGFPKPVEIQKRLFWSPDDLPALRDAILSYKGRIAFEGDRRYERLRAEKTAAFKQKRLKRQAKFEHPDLFGCD